MEEVSDWVHESAMNHNFLKDFIHAWSYFERANVKYQVPDLMRVSEILKAVGYSVTKVEKMEGESWAPGMVNGCTVEVQCPVSKTKMTLTAPEAECHCPKRSNSSWSVSWAGATAGMPSDSEAPVALIPGKALMVKICLNSLMSIVWPRDGEKFSTPYPLCDRLVKSLDCVYQKETVASIEPSRSLQSIGSRRDDSLLSSSDCSQQSNTTSSETRVATSTPMSSNSTTSVSEKGSKKIPQRHSLQSTPKVLSNVPPPNSPYWESSTARAKRYAESLKQREAEKKKPK
ncbi:uncharacterized protein LOC124157896 [Ischnura elegans]|uniref:uncharacterized protein LOC124157896 n=1 Tax=Ischnura elegans TaxID=197161 RepID=UPI001ED89400|nr:uncharacterized protein LOC124157896 [Ischnura elegans]